MSTLTVYTFEDAAGCEDTFSTQDPRVAKERGQKYGLRVLANEYEWTEIVPVEGWDFTTPAGE